jgi:hypothetical protein
MVSRRVGPGHVPKPGAVVDNLDGDLVGIAAHLNADVPTGAGGSHCVVQHAADGTAERPLEWQP